MAQLACGSQHCLVLTAEGELYACGNNSHGELGVGDRAARASPTRLDSLPSRMRFCAVSAGGSHSLCIEAGGAVLTWGHGGAGRLGHGDVPLTLPLTQTLALTPTLTLTLTLPLLLALCTAARL